MANKSILVIFGKKLPPKNKSWVKKFDKILIGEELENLIEPGSVQEASEMARSLARLTLPDGSRISKLFTYKGYDLWWVNYDNLYKEFCLPYTRYRRLLEYLKNFETVYLHCAPNINLFNYFLTSYGCKCRELKSTGSNLRKLLLPGGIFIQLILSAIFLVPLIFLRPKIMFWTNDKLDYPHAYDFRHRYVYKELEKRKIRFVQFIRSIQPWHKVLKHAWLRRRPVVYSAAIIYLIFEKFRWLERSKDRNLIKTIRESGSTPEQSFLISVATHYLNGNLRVTRWSIFIIRMILWVIGIQSAIIFSAASRTFHTILACKLSGVTTVGIQHGAIPRYYVVSDFMPDFDGEKSLSLDKYGLWSEWWRNYYIKYSRAYAPSQLFVSGPIRPSRTYFRSRKNRNPQNPIKVLFISEQLADPKEAMAYLSFLMKVADFDLAIKFRPQQDGFQDWLEKNNPVVLQSLRIFKNDIHEAAAWADILVGSHSSAVLEGLAELKPFVFFATQKWGDYFDLKSSEDKKHLFAENQNELEEKIRKNVAMSEEELKKLQKQFLGDPRKNGSKWVVDNAVQAVKLS